jgi:chemotaxis protein methyltransferase CheR
VSAERPLDAMRDLAAEVLGFAPSAVDARRLRTVLEQELARHTPEALAVGIAAREPALVDRLISGVTVGETYFFRHPEQFVGVAEQQHRLSGPVVRAWSAGCSTGEEAYSLAAMLLECVGHRAAVSVLGTDADAARLAVARAGTYGPWSCRGGAPGPWPTWRPAEGKRVQVREELQLVTRFERHNLNRPPPEEQFDLVFCRNVLIYLSPAVAERVRANLIRSLVPGGLLVLGAVEADIAPAGLRRLGPPGLQVFVRDDAPSLAPARAPGVESRPPRPAAAIDRAVHAAIARGPVTQHLELLARRERGELEGVAELLGVLVRNHPDYLPARLDQALLAARRGEHRAAAEQMRAVLERALRQPPDAAIDGPEPLPASYYVATASAFLGAKRRLA